MCPADDLDPESGPTRASPLARPLRAVRWLAGLEGVPYLARPTVRYDLIAACLSAMGWAFVIPQFTQVLGRKMFVLPAVLIAALQAETALGNLFGSVLADHLRKRRRSRAFALSRYVIAGSMGVLAILPTGGPTVDLSPGGWTLLPAASLGGYAFVGVLILPMICAAVGLNIKTSIWHSNYPTRCRGSLVSRVLIVNFLTIAATLPLAGWAMDVWPGAHRVLYLFGAGVTALGGWVYGHIRTRREKGMLRDAQGTPFRPLASLALLMRDRVYGRFMILLLLSASMVHMTGTLGPLILVEVFRSDYGQAGTVLALIPLTLQVSVMPVSGRLFDRMGPHRFRAVGCVLWAGSRCLLFLAVWAVSWPLLCLAFALRGMAGSTGAMAFHLGHTRFSQAGDSQLYMGANMTLQGLRGVLMPFVGVWLYYQVGLGATVLLIAAGVLLLAAGLFALSPEPSRGDRDEP